MIRTQEQRDLIVAYKATFGSDTGKAVLADLRNKTCMDRSAIVPGQPIDMNQVLYAEAQRAMVLYIIKKVEADLGPNTPETAKKEETL